MLSSRADIEYTHDLPYNKHSAYMRSYGVAKKTCGGQTFIYATSRLEAMFEISPCKTKAAFKVVPKGKLKLDMGALKEEFDVLLDAGIVLVLKIENEELTVHSYGEILFKTLKDEEKIRKISEKIYSYKK